MCMRPINAREIFFSAKQSFASRINWIVQSPRRIDFDQCREVHSESWWKFSGAFCGVREWERRGNVWGEMEIFPSALFSALACVHDSPRTTSTLWQGGKGQRFDRTSLGTYLQVEEMGNALIKSYKNISRRKKYSKSLQISLLPSSSSWHSFLPLSKEALRIGNMNLRPFFFSFLFVSSEVYILCSNFLTGTHKKSRELSAHSSCLRFYRCCSVHHSPGSDRHSRECLMRV